MRRGSRQKKRTGRAKARIFAGGIGVLFVAAVAVTVFYFSRETRAVAGDFSVYREATGLESITTTLTDQAWDTTISQAALYSIDTGRTTVTLSEAGHYLVLYNTGVEVVTGTAKADTHGYLNVNGSQSVYGRSSCYLENLGGQSKCWLSGAGIIETTAANQALKVQLNRTDDGTLSLRRLANSSGLNVLRLDDTWAYARIREVGGGQAFNTATWATVSLDTNDELDTGYSRSDGDITLAQPGRYLVMTNVHFYASTRPRGRNRLPATRLTLNGYEMEGTRVTATISGDNSVEDGVASYVGIIEATTTNQVLRLEGACLGEECGYTNNVANGTAISIAKLPDTVETISVYEAGGGQLVDATNDPILWDTDVRIDSAAFTHSTLSNTSRIIVNSDDDYLFFGSFYNSHTTISTTILDPHWEWRVNGTTKLTYGSWSAMNRGDESTYGTGHSGAAGGAILTSLLNGDYVEVVNTDESTGIDSDPSFQSRRTALQGIRISSLEVPDITVSSIGSQVASVAIPTANVYVDGAFVFSANKPFPTETITDITITETGTVDASADLSEIRLYYDLDTTYPYDCAGETYEIGDNQYGATSSAFSAPNGTATFSGSVVASTTQTVCVYVVLDIESTATFNETLDIEISNPSVDVILGGGPVGPNSAVALSGSTTLDDDYVAQKHYHWRLDNGSESTAESATGGSEDSVLVGLSTGNPRRMRLAVSNNGSVDSSGMQYLLEYATRTTSCADVASGWTDVGAAGGAWDMFDSTSLTDGENTTNIAVATGGVTDGNTNFVTPNGGVKDMGSQTGTITLGSADFTELEYSVVATNNAVEGESYCFRVTDAGTPLPRYDVYPEVSIAADVLVSALGSHMSIVDASTTDFYVGGSWAVMEQSSSRNIMEITIDELGTVDASIDLSNIRLYYDLDTTDPYDCTGETYEIGDSQYGATSSAFSAPNGTATFSDSVGISLTQSLCLYAVLDVGPDALDQDTIELEISDPGLEVVPSSGKVNPNSPVGPTGSTTIEKAILDQAHYHWRNDDGTEAGASSMTGGIEDTGILNVMKASTHRLRMEISNEGSTSTLPTVFTLEYAKRTGSCAASDSWEEVKTTGEGAWAMSDSIYLTNGDNTTNIAVPAGGVTDENTVFVTPNGGVLDTQATSSSVTLTSSNFLELEFAVEATTNAEFDTAYCFRLSGDGTEVTSYTNYPQATIRHNRDFFIQRGSTHIPNGDTAIGITAGTDYIAPSASSSAFIRITSTMHTGAGSTAGGGAQNANSVTVHISNPENITSSINFVRSGSVGSTQVTWEIVEYTGPEGGDNEMIVRSAQVYTTGAKSLTGTVSVNGVINDSDVAVFLTGQSIDLSDTASYQTGIVTTDWLPATDQVYLERGAYLSGPGNAASVSFAVVEFVGPNWHVQRAEHTYGAVGTTETETITTVNDLSRTFIHAQHRTDQNTVSNYGHTVWLSAANTVSFALHSSATVPGNHISVAWIIENSQTNGFPMNVTRSSGTLAAGGPEPSTFSIYSGTTLQETSNASIFTTMYSAGIDTSHPRAIMGYTVASTTHYELWISDTDETRSYRTEIVEWPTAVLTFKQNYFRFYTDNDALDPTDPWPAGVIDLGENAAITGIDTPPAPGERTRLRMSLNVSGANVSRGSLQFKLQYGVRETSCSAITQWFDIGDPGSTTAVWRGYNATPLDGTPLSTDPPTGGDLNLSVSDRAGTYEEQNSTALNPYKIFIGEDVEYDWNLEAYQVTELARYCFRMTEPDGTELGEYLYYPAVVIAGFEAEQTDWRWYGDETVLTPVSPLAGTNTAPSTVPWGDALKLRVVVEETAGRNGDNVKYKLQWSEFSDFSTVFDVDDIDTCESGSRWCYFDGAGTEGATITARVISTADNCTGGTGDGCGTHNEFSYTPDIKGEVGTTTTDSSGTTVSLQHTYDDPVFIVESLTGDASGGSGNRPAAAVITATSTSSFTVRIQEPDNEGDAHGVETIGYIVMERGAYELPDGRRVDVGTIDTAHYYGNAVTGTSDDTCSFTQTFTNAPVVLASLQSENNTGSPDFLTASVAIVTSDDFMCSLEVPDGETNEPALSETIGWIAVEGGRFTNNTILFEASTTAESVTGWSDTPWYEQSFSQEFTTIPGFVATKQTRNGAEGGWVRYVTADLDSVLLAFDERDDGERTHTEEVVGYIAFSHSGVIYGSGESDFSFTSGTKREFEFTITHHDAHPNVTYFFRLYDVGRGTAVSTSSTSVPPSLSTEGATLSFAITGIASGTATEGVTTDITTTATSVPFGSLTLGVAKSAAQRLTVSTNATAGYQILAFEGQDLVSDSGATIDDIVGSNEEPVSWEVGCSGGATSCYGYHSGDNTLLHASNRFLIDDTYAPMTGVLKEVVYNSGPVTAESTDMVYRVHVNSVQPAGQYESDVSFVVVPVF